MVVPTQKLRGLPFRTIRSAPRLLLPASIVLLMGLQAPAAHSQSLPRDGERQPAGLTAADWSSIRTAYEANRHAAFAADGGYNARNTGQAWLTHFDGRGFSVQPDAGGWAWGLQLEGYGFRGSERVVGGSATVTGSGQRVAYDWDATLQEWYVNDTRGLEHGYTVRHRPVGQDGPLSFRLAVRGGLRAEILADGSGARFENTDGGLVLTYSGLSVVDADGRELAAHFEPITEGLLLTVDERGARYPLTIDPIAQQAYVKASNTDSTDYFGASVAISGDTVVIGAQYEASNATGVNGNQSDNSATQAGAAYVFVRSGGSWSQQAYLKASNTGTGDQFGSSVTISGDTIAVAAIREDSDATGVNGSGSDPNINFDSGAVYVFVRSGTTWSQQAYVKASNTGDDDFFGDAVSVWGDLMIVGAAFEDSNATGVNGNQSNNSATESGAAYIFVRSGTSWSQQAYLKASNTGSFDYFGQRVATAGDDTVVVGAWGEDSNATGVNGNESDNSATESGAAYVFVWDGSAWSQQAYLKASNTGAGDTFGISVAETADTILIGAWGEDSRSTGVNGDQSNNLASASGAAYVFVRSGSTWSQQAYLKASNTDAQDLFGCSVAVYDDAAVIGAYGESSNATGVNGTQNNNSASQAGAAYAFTRSGTTWSQQYYLKASNTDALDWFGFSVAMSGLTAVIGAPYEASNATGVNGNESDDSDYAAGAAYIFERS